MTHGSLFSGLEGFGLAAERVGWRNVFQCEIDIYCLATLFKNFPHVAKHGNIKATNFKIYRGLIDVLSGGFPCQPFSQAGQRKGGSDDRFLWPEYERAIDEIRPRWVVAENVTGIRTMALDLVCSSLESKGYAVQPVIIPASALGAWHRRERVWILANDNSARAKVRDDSQERRDAESIDRLIAENKVSTDPIINELQKWSWHDLSGSLERRERPEQSYWGRYWIEVVADFCRDNARLPGRVDRIKSLGNSIVPQVAETIFQYIDQIESHERAQGIY